MKTLSRIAFTAAVLTALSLCFDASTSSAEAQRQPQVIELEEIQIEGRVQKPNAFYILNRSNIGYEVLDLRTSFVRDIVRTVQREPF